MEVREGGEGGREGGRESGRERGREGEIEREREREMEEGEGDGGNNCLLISGLHLGSALNLWADGCWLSGVAGRPSQ